MRSMLTGIVLVNLLVVGQALSAQEIELDVDWEEALDFAVLVGTVMDDYGETWETYFDEEQQFSWVQPSTASREDVLASMQAGKFGVNGPRSCIWLPVLPHSMTIYDSGDWEHYSGFTYGGSCGYNCWGYYHEDRDCWIDVDGYIRTVARSQINYTDMEEWYRELDADPDCWNWDVDDFDKWDDSGLWFYEMMEEDDVEGEEDWDYCSGSTTLVSRYRWSACGAYRYLEIGYRYSS
jgi:hypothetical protein